MIKIGLLINPIAGIGGSIAFKGSDDLTLESALALGGSQRSYQRTERALRLITEHSYTDYKIICTDTLTEGLLKQLRLNVEPHLIEPTNSARDTQNAVELFNSLSVDLIVFSGGDGTARDVLDSINDDIPILGIPSGVKMHSGCFAVSPESAGELLKDIISGKLVSAHYEEIRDIDESQLLAGKVNSRYYGEVLVPKSLQYIQQTKISGQEHEPLVLDEISEYVCSEMESDKYYFIGAGTSCAAVMNELGLGEENTLLGVDCVLDGQLVQSDCTAADLNRYASLKESIIILSITGGQGQLFGRGNQQFDECLLSNISSSNIWIISPKAKLAALNSRPMLIDTNKLELDIQLSGLYTVITGFNDRVLYPANYRLYTDE